MTVIRDGKIVGHGDRCKDACMEKHRGELGLEERVERLERLTWELATRLANEVGTSWIREVMREFGLRIGEKGGESE